MTRQEAFRLWREDCLPCLRIEERIRSRIDRPARRESWNNWTDFLCKSGRITDKQYDSWTHPRGVETVLA